jgi:pimeloyl-ACP methyl ester carboxylesterase
MFRPGKNIGRDRNIVACWFILLLLNLAGSQLVPRTLAQSMLSQVDLAKPDSRASTAEAFVTVGTTELHYIDRGVGRPVVMIHGNAGDLHDFEFGTFNLVARYYHAIAFDLPGHGLSREPHKAKGTIHEQVTILHQAIAAMGIKDPILVGHSWGGSIALAYALCYPREISALVLLAPAAYFDNRQDMPGGFLLRLGSLSHVCLALLKPIFGRRLLRNGLKDAFYPDPVPDDYMKHSAAVWLDGKHLRAFMRHDVMLGPGLQEMSSEYSKIRVPVIIVTGNSDWTISAEQNALNLHHAISKSRLVVIPHAGHQIPEMHPEVVLRAVNMATLDAIPAVGVEE